MRGTLAEFESILDTVGNAGVVHIDRLKHPGINLFAKIEAFNPLGSVKDRLALGVIEAVDTLRRAQARPGIAAKKSACANL